MKSVESHTVDIIKSLHTNFIGGEGMEIGEPSNIDLLDNLFNLEGCDGCWCVELRLTLHESLKDEFVKNL